MDLKEMKFFEMLDYRSSLLRQIIWLLKLNTKTDETTAREKSLQKEVDDIDAEIRRRLMD